jgi:hypothetical protein
MVTKPYIWNRRSQREPRAPSMSDPLITCPNCKASVKLTESLAAPLIEATRRQFERALAEKEVDFHRRHAALHQQEAALATARQEIEARVTARLGEERAAIVACEARKARQAALDEIAKAQTDKAALEERLRQREASLAEATRNELELRRERQRLHEEREQFELTKQRAIDAERARIRDLARKEADEQSRLRLAEKDKTITDLQLRLHEALRQAEQGSQQLQGEVQELDLEAQLRQRFPGDVIQPVPKGECGGDVLQHVIGPLGQTCGCILWESKRTKNWSDGWLPKLRQDMRASAAEIAVMVSKALPKDTETFDHIDGVWVTSSQCLIPVAVALRHLVIELAAARKAGEGQQSKMELVYQYLTGPRFRQRVQAIVEKFTDMRDDLDRERRTMTRLWAKRAEQIHGVLDATGGMYGDLQGIAGRTLQEIEGLEFKLLPDGDRPASRGMRPR